MIPWRVYCHNSGFFQWRFGTALGIRGLDCEAEYWKTRAAESEEDTGEGNWYFDDEYKRKE
ncbi:hypothetical protein H9L39_12168 [Fusarium oxysporum f. sp. albedinis]|jgi:hypothetical protein|nr:hypothetical protein H9L39_12168 [Fusarium oxysporum f. sp. albedinis]